MNRILKNCMGTCLLSVTCITIAYSQVLGGFFNQKGTQRKYMLQQIALYQTYLGYVKKGYNITRNGLQAVRDIRGGEFNLHNQYYRSLKQVNPAIRNQQQVRRIIALCTETKEQLQHIQKGVHRDDVFAPSEKDYVRDVAMHMNSETGRILQELEIVITPGTIQMSDDERLQKIQKIAAEAVSIYACARSFSDDIRVLALQRKGSRREIEVMKKLYQLP